MKMQPESHSHFYPSCARVCVHAYARVCMCSTHVLMVPAFIFIFPFVSNVSRYIRMSSARRRNSVFPLLFDRAYAPRPDFFFFRFFPPPFCSRGFALIFFFFFFFFEKKIVVRLTKRLLSIRKARESARDQDQFLVKKGKKIGG